jgi:arabinose-5-phosphate isomerase
MDREKLINTARRVIEDESRALTVLAETIGDNLAHAAELILNAPGRVIV